MKIAVDDSVPLKTKIDASWPGIKFFGGDRTIAKKIVILYYPDKHLNIFKAKDMEYFCKRLNVQYERQSFDEYGKPYEKLTIGEKYELLTNRLLHYKENNDITKNWSNIYYGFFLYQELGEVYDEVPRLSTSKQISQRETVPLNSYGLLFEPKFHEELLYMFSVMHREIGFPYIVQVQTSYPDIIAMNIQREIKRIELEVLASHFDHDPTGCDLIVCWENDLDPKPDNWPEIVALKDLT